MIIAGISTFLFHSSSDVISSSISREAQLVAEYNADTISEWFRSIENEMFLLSEVPAVKAFEMDKVKVLMNTLISKRPDYGGILVADRTGTATTVEGHVIDIGSRDYFINAISTGGLVYSDPMVTQATDLATIMLARPIFDDSGRRVVGVLAIAVALEQLQKIAAEMNLTGHGFGWLINDNKLVVGHPEPEFLGSDELFTRDAELRPIVEKMIRGSSGVETYRKGGTNRLVAYSPIEQNNWSIALEANERDINNPLIVMRTISLLGAIGAILIAIIISYLLVASLTKPIISLKESAEQVAAGNLRATFSTERKDEIGLLGAAFNHMVQSLRHLIENVQLSADRVLDTSVQLSGVTSEAGASIQEIASGANEFSQTVSVMNTSVSEVSSSATLITTDALDGEKALERTREQMKELMVSIQSLSGIIESLDASSSEIGQIVETISDITEQTNLLALNAAIEAARAGDHGRGFAVVADEVRKLSEQSNQATQDISKLIIDIQQRTKQAVMGMHEGVANVEDTSHVVAESAELLSTIIESIGSIGERIGLIGDDTRQIDIGGQEIAAATQEQSATIQEVANWAQELNRMAGELRKLVDVFQIAE